MRGNEPGPRAAAAATKGDAWTKSLPGKPHRILFVCLGNICRSPTAQGVLRDLVRKAAPGLKVDIDSAGTAGYHIGAAPDPRSQSAALRRGIDISDLRARQISRSDFTTFDLILAMDRDNLRDLEAKRTSHARAKLRLFLEYAPQTGRLEIPDPYYGGVADFELVLDLCDAAARGLIVGLQEGA
jgi:protein-tyrosine phosphatase